MYSNKNGMRKKKLILVSYVDENNMNFYFGTWMG